MMPPAQDTTTGPTPSRPKRGAALRAEGVFRALAQTGTVPNSSSGNKTSPSEKSLDKKNNSKAPVSSAPCSALSAPPPASTQTADAAPTECRPGLAQKRSVPGRRHSSGGNHAPVSAAAAAAAVALAAAAAAAAAGKREQPACNRDVTLVDQANAKPATGLKKQNQRGVAARGKEETGGDMPLKRGVIASGRADNRMKPSTKAAGGAGVARLLERFSAFGTKVRVPSNATVEDAWKALDVVLANLLRTSCLTVDELVGHARLRRYSNARPERSECGKRSVGGGGSGSSGSTSSVSGGGVVAAVCKMLLAAMLFCVSPSK